MAPRQDAVDRAQVQIPAQASARSVPSARTKEATRLRAVLRDLTLRAQRAPQASVPAAKNPGPSARPAPDGSLSRISPVSPPQEIAPGPSPEASRSPGTRASPAGQVDRAPSGPDLALAVLVQAGGSLVAGDPSCNFRQPQRSRCRIHLRLLRCSLFPRKERRFQPTSREGLKIGNNILD